MEPTADGLGAEIDKSGRVAVYGIQFDTGKSTIMPESAAVLGEIAKMLQTRVDLKLNIEGHTDIDFHDGLDYSDEKAADVVALDDALRDLAAVDARKARAIELRYFGGLSVEEAAEALGISVATMGRETRYAEAWLRRRLLRN